ncbi:hypothetical protein BdWA1_003456 [Babesia duncani]|uniref:Uncharacterized protein n=1 Tax=Babesia duncani TaxID=323732 RepID=A0AAD9PI62_9APIC|nr:hypothetical protein BdWA1_003456 [Babesia duncani]
MFEDFAEENADERFNPGSVDISILTDTEHVHVSNIIVGQTTLHVFVPKGITGFNLIKDGDEVIWEDETIQTLEINYYHVKGTLLLAFYEETRDHEIIKENHFHKDPEGVWRVISKYKFGALRVKEYSVVRVDLWKIDTSENIKVRDNSTAFYVDRTIEILPTVIVWSVVDTCNVELYERGTLMEQCKQIVVRGPRNGLHCKMVFETPEGDTESYYEQMADGKWEKLAKPPPQDLKNLFSTPTPNKFDDANKDLKAPTVASAVEGKGISDQPRQSEAPTTEPTSMETHEGDDKPMLQNEKEGQEFHNLRSEAAREEEVILPFNPGSVDISILTDTEHVDVSNTIVGQTTLHVFVPKGITGFNVIRIGDEIIWISYTSHTKEIKYYEASKIRLLEFVDKTENHEPGKKNYYKNEPGKAWIEIDYYDFDDLRFQDSLVITLDIDDNASDEYVIMTSDFNLEFYRMSSMFESLAVRVRLYSLSNLFWSKVEFVMEQCAVMWFPGQHNDRQCKIIMDIPKGQYMSFHIHMSTSTWVTLHGILPKYLKLLLAAPELGASFKTDNKEVPGKGLHGLLSNSNLRSYDLETEEKEQQAKLISDILRDYEEFKSNNRRGGQWERGAFNRNAKGSFASKVRNSKSYFGLRSNFITSCILIAISFA